MSGPAFVLDEALEELEKLTTEPRANWDGLMDGARIRVLVRDIIPIVRRLNERCDSALVAQGCAEVDRDSARLTALNEAAAVARKFAATSKDYNLHGARKAAIAIAGGIMALCEVPK